MTSPTPVQRAVIPALLRGRDAIAIAHTGSGKTASFALPILSALAPDPYGVFALVLSPTRELAFQLAEQFRALGVGCGLRDAVVVGGLDQLSQARELSRRPHVVVASPGRLRALFAADPSLRGAFAKLRFLVMDEADRLLEDSFEGDLAAVLQGVAPRPRSDGDGSARQTVLV
ncbi:DEAD/DEAH box helicase, partial [Helicosporidium sp. ATCC 50920]